MRGIFKGLSAPKSSSAGSGEWDLVAARTVSAWYLDPLVARQKRLLHQQLIRRWAGERFVGLLLKTDLFEESHGQDQILFDLYPDAAVIGIDISHACARRAAERSPNRRCHFLTADVTQIPLRDSCMDLVISTSTLDHFEKASQLHAALAEIQRVLRPGGVAIITMDNGENPLYWLLRWTSRRGWTPFRLGQTVSLKELAALLGRTGLEVASTDVLIHNPRLVSTGVFLLLRRLLGRFADGPIRGLLTVFSWLDRLPTRRWTACFVAACGRKPLRAAGGPEQRQPV